MRGVLRVAQDNQLLFWCAGCGEHHAVRVGPSTFRANAPVWGWNGDYDRPTFTPSVLIQTGHYNPHAAGQPCWCTYKERVGREPAFACKVCHSFVTDGQIQYLGDSTHALAGQTVPLEVKPEPDHDS